VLLLLGVVLWHWLSRPSVKGGAQPQAVEVARAVRGDMPVILNEIGTVTPEATVTVLPNANVNGYLTEVAYREGQFVTKGQFLAQIDPRPYQVLRRQAEAALAKDQAALAQARYDLSLYEALHNRKAIAEQTYFDQKFAVQQDEAAVKQDQANIAQYMLDITYCHIVSPVSGRVGLRLVDVGNYITGSSNTGIVIVTTMKPMLVQFGVAQNDIEKVARRFNTPGVVLPVTAYDSSTHKPLATGALYAIGNQMNTATGQTPMRATYANEDQALWPNAFVNVRILVDTIRNAVLVPTPAVLTGAPGTYVYLVNKDHTVSIRKVTIGPGDGARTAVLSGLELGDTVVTDGTDRLSDKAKIRVQSNPGKAPAAHGTKAGTAPT
jgi:multidrug efflux system membrane fusion protein